MTNYEERTIEKDGYRIDVVFFFGMVCSFGAAIKETENSETAFSSILQVDCNLIIIC